MSEDKKFNTHYWTGQRSGKSIDQIHKLLSMYDPDIYNKIEITVISSVDEKENQDLQKQVEELKEENEKLSDRVKSLQSTIDEMKKINGVLRNSYNGLCDDLHNGEHIEMSWVKDAIKEASHCKMSQVYQKQNQNLQKQIEELKNNSDSYWKRVHNENLAKLQKAEKVIEFYADKENWDGYSESEMIYETGGDKARNYLKEN